MIGSATLQSDGIVIERPNEGESSPDILKELDALLKRGFSPITINDLSNLARKVYLRYMITGAHNASLGGANRPVGLYGPPGSQKKPEHEDVEKPNWNGDRQMANLTLRMRDSLWYYEFCHAISDGDIGRVLEIIKVIAEVLSCCFCLTQSLAPAVFILGSWCIQLWQGAPCACSYVHPCLR
jgi:hypothetical protein